MVKMKKYNPVADFIDEPNPIPNLLSGNTHTVWNYNSKVQTVAPYCLCDPGKFYNDNYYFVIYGDCAKYFM